MIYISGASDDLVCIEGDVRDEVSPGRVITIGDNARGVRVLFRYAASKSSAGVWRASVEQIR